MMTATTPRAPIEAIKAVQQEEDDHKAEAAIRDTWAMLDARRFDLDKPPPPTEPIFTIRDMAVTTPGNITVVQAQIKAGKTAILGAMMAAALNPEAEENMTLGIRSTGASDRAVIHFDCEQSRDDHHAVICNTLRRAGLTTAPEGLRSYCLTDVPAPRRLEMLRAELQRAGDVFAIFLDGVADLTFRVNDEEEANALVNELHALSIKYDCGLIAVLHENHGSETGKTRGHLGSQLERKQYAGLRMAKDAEGITTLWTDRSRKASILKAHGLRFAYDMAAGLHLPVETADEARHEAARDELAVLAADIFRQAPSGGLGWSALITQIMNKAGLKNSGARKRQEKMHALGVIRKNLFHNWELGT